jgi:hypothetical protein
MSLEAGSLWEASPTWRRLLLLAGALVVLGLLGAPWQPQRTGPAPTAAAPSYQPIIRPVTPVTTTPQGPPNVAAAPSTGQADMLDPSLQMAPPVAMPPPPPVVVPRHSTSSVVWSSEQGRMPGPSVSGGGLILLNTRGGTSTGYASRPAAGTTGSSRCRRSRGSPSRRLGPRPAWCRAVRCRKCAGPSSRASDGTTAVWWCRWAVTAPSVVATC